MYKIYSVGVLAHGSWKLLNELEDPELRGLASRLPNTILHSHADTTVKKSLVLSKDGELEQWVITLKPVPANQHLGEESRSKSAAEEAHNAISWVHATSGLVSLASHPLVKAVAYFG